jgi:hypothetical protein
MKDQALKDFLGEATHLAILMVDQIEWVDVYTPAKVLVLDGGEEVYQPHLGDADFYRQATAFVRQPKQRDGLRRIVDSMSRRIAGNPVALRVLDAIDVNAAAELVTSAVKGLLVAASRNGQWLTGRRLVIKFTSVEAPWVQDPVKQLDGGHLFAPGDRPAPLLN